MQGLAALTKYGKGHVERMGRDEYVACIKDNHGNYFELKEIDPQSAQRSAQEFCTLNGIALQIFTVSPEVVRAHLNDIGDFFQEKDEQVRPAFPSGLRRAG